MCLTGIFNQHEIVPLLIKELGIRGGGRAQWCSDHGSSARDGMQSAVRHENRGGKFPRVGADPLSRGGGRAAGE